MPACLPSVVRRAVVAEVLEQDVDPVGEARLREALAGEVGLLRRHGDACLAAFGGRLLARVRIAVGGQHRPVRVPAVGEHVHVGKRLAGLSTEDIERVTVGSSATGWTEHERALLRAVEELLADAMISDETWAILARGLNDKQLLEFPLLVGFYQSIAYLQNSVRFRLGRAAAKAGLCGKAQLEHVGYGTMNGVDGSAPMKS